MQDPSENVPTAGAYLRRHAAWLNVPTAEIWNRILWIRCGTKTGTAFTIEVDGFQFLVTAAHVIEEHDDARIEWRRDGEWVSITGTYIDAEPAGFEVDIAILGLSEQLTPASEVEFGHDGWVFGQDCSILGYPFDVQRFDSSTELSRLYSGSSIPMVKRANFAWVSKAPGAGHSTLVMDCYATKGFSGGPVVGWKMQSSMHISIAGVVSHYVAERQPVLAGGSVTALTAEQNPGVLVAPGIQHALDAIYSAGPSLGAKVTAYLPSTPFA